MGTYKIVKNAAFSTSAVGKLDFENKIFRRKINGSLERNWIEFTRNDATSKTPVNLDKSDQWKIKIKFFNPTGTIGVCPTYSVSDYINKRGFYVDLYFGGGSLTVFVYIGSLHTFDPYIVKGKQDSIAIGAVPVDSVTEHSLEIDIDFALRSCTALKYNGVNKTITPGTLGDITTRFNDAATNTISIGSYSFQEPAVTLGLARPSFIQLSQNGKIELHHDFLGDNDLEIYTEKAKGILLKKGAQIVHSAPISI